MCIFVPEKDNIYETTNLCLTFMLCHDTESTDYQFRNLGIATA